MNMRWELRLTCRDCGAILTFADERPSWQSAGQDRFATCPACDGKAPIARPGIDLGFDKAFDIFRPRPRS